MEVPQSESSSQHSYFKNDFKQPYSPFKQLSPIQKQIQSQENYWAGLYDPTSPSQSQSSFILQ